MALISRTAFCVGFRVKAPVTRRPPQVSSPKELPLQALSEPYVNLSTHTAPIVQPFVFLFYTKYTNGQKDSAAVQQFALTIWLLFVDGP